MLDSRPTAFDDRNFFFHGLLGLISLSRKLDVALAVESPPDADSVPPDNPWLLCVLGAVAFRTKLAETLATAAPDLPPPAPSSASDERESLRGLLR